MRPSERVQPRSWFNTALPERQRHPTTAMRSRPSLPAPRRSALSDATSGVLSTTTLKLPALVPPSAVRNGCRRLREAHLDRRLGRDRRRARSPARPTSVRRAPYSTPARAGLLAGNTALGAHSPAAAASIARSSGMTASCDCRLHQAGRRHRPGHPCAREHGDEHHGCAARHGFRDVITAGLTGTVDVSKLGRTWNRPASGL